MAITNLALAVLCIIATARHQTVAGRYAGGGGHGGIAVVFHGDSCNPDVSLYKDQSPKDEDLRIINREADALNFVIGKKDVARMSQTAGLFMHTYNLAVKTTVDGKLGAMTKKLEAASDASGKLARRIKSLKYIAGKLAPALGVLGAALSIVAGEAFPDPNKEAIDLLEKQMHMGFNKLREDMDRKYTELKNFVEDSVQYAQIADLKAQIEEMTIYYTNCAQDEHAEECVRNSVRNIEANKFRFTNMDLVPTQNNTRLIKRYEMEMEFYRKYLLVSALAHVTSIMTFDPVEDMAEIETFKDRLKGQISDFKAVVKRNTKAIVNTWWNEETYLPLCLSTATKQEDEDGKAVWNIRVTVNDWSNCRAVGSKGDLTDKEAVCREWKRRYSSWGIGNKVWKKAKAYWKEYEMKLFAADSVYSTLEKMLDGDDINQDLLTRLTTQIEEPAEERSKLVVIPEAGI